MKTSSNAEVHVALIHYPVLNKNGGVIASAVTNLDLHDIARSARTYGVKTFYVVTPLRDQQALVKRIVSHWTGGVAAYNNPARKAALETIRIVETVADAAADIRRQFGRGPEIVATTARPIPGAIGFDMLRQRLRQPDPLLVLFGTAWGLAETVVASADYTLAPLKGASDYNHLSVRSAAAIVLDRLLAVKGH